MGLVVAIAAYLQQQSEPARSDRKTAQAVYYLSMQART